MRVDQSVILVHTNSRVQVFQVFQASYKRKNWASVTAKRPQFSR